MDDLQAQKIAQDLVNSDRLSDQASFNIEIDGQPTSEVVVVIAIRTDKGRENIFRKISESIAIKSVAGPKGLVCPVCNGTGRVG